MTDFTESVSDAFEGMAAERIDEEKGVIRGVKLLGLRSKNRRNYDSVGVQRSALKLLEGVSIFIDHPDKANVRSTRSMKDKWGNSVTGTIRYENGKGYFGDVRYNKKHPLTEQILEDIRSAPNTLGMSINGEFRSGGTDSTGDVIVEELLSLRSVDLVTAPATTAGMFEHVEEEQPMTLEELKLKHPDLYKSAIESASLEVADKATKEALEAEQKKSKELTERLAAIESEAAEAKRVAVVRADVEKCFEGVEIEKEVLDLAVECACEMKDTTKFKAFASKLSPMLKEVPDSEEDEKTPGEESVDDKSDEKKDSKIATESASGRGYTPGRKKAAGSYGMNSLMSAIGKGK